MEPFLSHRCNIERPRESNDGGFITKLWSLKKAGVRCLVREVEADFDRMPFGEDLEVDTIVYLPNRTDIRPRIKEDEHDRIVITYPRGSSETTLLVQFVKDSGALAVVPGIGSLKAYCKRVRPDEPPVGRVP